jgi:hypothetical protein
MLGAELTQEKALVYPPIPQEKFLKKQPRESHFFLVCSFHQLTDSGELVLTSKTES